MESQVLFGVGTHKIRYTIEDLGFNNIQEDARLLSMQNGNITISYTVILGKPAYGTPRMAQSTMFLNKTTAQSDNLSRFKKSLFLPL